jgi:hypothetical protein
MAEFMTIAILVILFAILVILFAVFLGCGIIFLCGLWREVVRAVKSMGG